MDLRGAISANLSASVANLNVSTAITPTPPIPAHPAIKTGFVSSGFLNSLTSITSICLALGRSSKGCCMFV